MTTPDKDTQGDTPFQKIDEKPTEKRQFGSHRDDWWLDISYAEDINLDTAIDSNTLRAKPKPQI